MGCVQRSVTMFFRVKESASKNFVRSAYLGTQGVLLGLFNIVVLLSENVLKPLQEMDINLSIGVHSGRT